MVFESYAERRAGYAATDLLVQLPHGYLDEEMFACAAAPTRAAIGVGQSADGQLADNTAFRGRNRKDGSSYDLPGATCQRGTCNDVLY